jgi:hypothetical protein
MCQGRHAKLSVRAMPTHILRSPRCIIGGCYGGGPQRPVASDILRAQPILPACRIQAYTMNEDDLVRAILARVSNRATRTDYSDRSHH